MSFEMSIIKQQAAESDECKSVSSPLNVQESRGRSLCLVSIVSYVGLALFTEWILFNPSKQLKLVMCNESQGRNRNLQAIHIVIME